VEYNGMVGRLIETMCRPERLELTAADEVLAAENIDILKRNGFEVVRQLDDDEEGRLLLVAQPVSKGTVFDMKGCISMRRAYNCLY